MPTYEYLCAACSHRFEEFQGIKETPLKKCPVCKKNKLQRLFGAGAAIVFKGGGFYQTDYRSESYKKGAESAKGTETAPKSEPAAAAKPAESAAKSTSASL